MAGGDAARLGAGGDHLMRQLFLTLTLAVALWRIQVAVDLGIAASRRPKPAAEQQARAFKPMLMPLIPPRK